MMIDTLDIYIYISLKSSFPSKSSSHTGDLTKWSGGAIVNAANERMLGGGGVDGAIHRAAGRELVEACRDVPEVRRGVRSVFKQLVLSSPPHHLSRAFTFMLTYTHYHRCPTGEARITKGFDLPAKHVIHTVGPIYSDDEASEPLLSAAHRYVYGAFPPAPAQCSAV